jgi:hypothetical protein
MPRMELTLAEVSSDIGCVCILQMVGLTWSTFAAKKIKADLIEKAKIKKHFFKSVKGKEGQDGGQVDIDPAAIFNRDEGKFAPERKEEEGDEGSNILYQMRNREEVALQKDEKKGRGKDDRRSQQAQPVNGATKSSLRQGDAKHDEVVMSKGERQALRDKKTERWHSQSGSQRGRERGQPNLGARMDLLLERIKQQS